MPGNAFIASYTPLGSKLNSLTQQKNLTITLDTLMNMPLLSYPYPGKYHKIKILSCIKKLKYKGNH